MNPFFKSIIFTTMAPGRGCGVPWGLAVRQVLRFQDLRDTAAKRATGRTIQIIHH